MNQLSIIMTCKVVKLFIFLTDQLALVDGFNWFVFVSVNILILKIRILRDYVLVRCIIVYLLIDCWLDHFRGILTEVVKKFWQLRLILSPKLTKLTVNYSASTWFTHTTSHLEGRDTILYKIKILFGLPSFFVCVFVFEYLLRLLISFSWNFAWSWRSI